MGFTIAELYADLKPRGYAEWAASMASAEAQLSRLGLVTDATSAKMSSLFASAGRGAPSFGDKLRDEARRTRAGLEAFYDEVGARYSGRAFIFGRGVDRGAASYADTLRGLHGEVQVGAVHWFSYSSAVGGVARMLATGRVSMEHFTMALRGSAEISADLARNGLGPLRQMLNSVLSSMGPLGWGAAALGSAFIGLSLAANSYARELREVQAEQDRVGELLRDPKGTPWGRMLPEESEQMKDAKEKLAKYREELAKLGPKRGEPESGVIASPAGVIILGENEAARAAREAHNALVDTLQRKVSEQEKFIALLREEEETARIVAEARDYEARVQARADEDREESLRRQEKEKRAEADRQRRITDDHLGYLDEINREQERADREQERREDQISALIDHEFQRRAEETERAIEEGSRAIDAMFEDDGKRRPLRAMLGFDELIEQIQVGAFGGGDVQQRQLSAQERAAATLDKILVKLGGSPIGFQIK